MLRYARWFPMVFFTGFTALALAVGLSSSAEGVFFGSLPLVVALRGFGFGIMAAGCGMWIGLCRSYGGKPGLTPFFDLMLTGGSALLLVSLLLYPTPLGRMAMWSGLALNSVTLLIGLAAMVFDPAYPCHLEMVWPQDGRYWFDPSMHDEQPHQGRRYSMIPDDLTRIEGIGPKIQQILFQAGIVNYAGIARRTPDELKRILQAGHFRAPIDTTTWPQQARLAAEGQWDDLHHLQGHLRGGRASG